MFEIIDLHCGYGKKLIIKGLSLNVNSGDFLGIIGPNGSGKTTLLRAMTRILKAKKGSVVFDGEDINKISFKEFASRVAVVSQSSETLNMTVEEFVLLGRIPYYKKLQFMENKRDREIAQENMRLTEIIDFKDSFLNEISGGQRQLALIARALTQQPELLLLDEPTTYLDITHQVKILDLIRCLNNRMGITVIMVMHDLNLASEYCQKLVLLNDGKIHKYGNPQEVLDYRIIEEVYKTIVVVKNNPISNKPYMLLVSKEAMEQKVKYPF